MLVAFPKKKMRENKTNINNPQISSPNQELGHTIPLPSIERLRVIEGGMREE